MFKTPLSPQAEYRAEARQQTLAAPTLAARFPTLTSLAVELAFRNAMIPAFDHELKYFVNLANAKSVLHIQCSNPDCFRGDFNLTDELAEAVAARQEVVKGKRPCQGWTTTVKVLQVRCQTVLSYKLTLKY